jgi:hypothetical protein
MAPGEGLLGHSRKPRPSPSCDVRRNAAYFAIWRLCPNEANANSEPRFLQGGRTARLPRTTRSRTNDPLCPFPARRPFCESTIADKERQGFTIGTFEFEYPTGTGYSWDMRASFFPPSRIRGSLYPMFVK